MDPSNSAQSTCDSHAPQQQMPAAVEAVIQLGYPPEIVLFTYQQLTTGSSSHHTTRSGNDQLEGTFGGTNTNAVDAGALLTSVQTAMESISACLTSVSTSDRSDTSTPPLYTTGAGVDSSTIGTTTCTNTPITTVASTPPGPSSGNDAVTVANSQTTIAVFQEQRSPPVSSDSSSMIVASPSATPNANAPLDEEAARERKRQLDRLKALRAENRQLKVRQTCRKCRRKSVDFTFLPCGHFVCCEECGSQFDKCPVCKKTILADVRTFLS